ncbi:sensor histidine kinase [Methanococcoides alaskense]
MAGAPLQEITDFAREEAVKLTKSKQGYLAFMSPDEGSLIMHSWSKDAMKECAIKDRQFIYPIETTGLWGEAVKQRKPIITNDYQASSSLKKGYPQGHVELTRHMNVPIFDGNRIVAVAGVGNKEEDYDESDLRQLILLMQGMWRLIQRKQMEDALQKYSKELSKAEVELKSLDRMEVEFISSKKDLTPVTEYGELIDGETLDIIDDLKNKAIDNVLHYSQRLRRLVDSIVYTSMEDAGKVEYNFEPVDISRLLEDSLLDTIFVVEEKDILVEKIIPDSLPLINGDEEKLTDMFTVLIDDAIRFTPPKGKLTIKIDAEEDDLHIMVKDSGPGIPEKLIPHMFQRFYEIGASIKQSYEGLESGLYICKKIVDAHKGSIQIESKIGAGTEVHVWLPRISGSSKNRNIQK